MPTLYDNIPPLLKQHPIVMSISHVSGRAKTRKDKPCGERETSGYKYRIAIGTAITSNGDNDTPVRP